MSEVKIETKRYKGQKIIYKRNEDGSLELIRVLSTDPKVYLKKDFQPGHKLEINKLED